jgi:hypothetical protein
MNLPKALVTAIEQQNVVLVLGAGASFDSKNGKGENPPSGAGLKRLLASKYLDDDHENDPLNLVSAYAINETDLITVQTYIKEIFADFPPTESHYALARYRWAGLATTNYDCLVEDAYKNAQQPLQKVIPRIENGDRVLELQSDPNNILYLKLHGCLTRINNPDCPLILTRDQYIDYLKGRDRVFGNLRDWSYERTLVFIGHGGGDPDLIQTIYDLKIPEIARPRHYMIKPNNNAAEKRFWERTKKVQLLDGTFAEFIEALQKAINPEFIKISSGHKDGDHPIVARFTSHSKISDACSQYLTAHIYYPKSLRSEQAVSAGDFYKGFNGDWAPIELDYDVPRKVTDELLEQIFLLEDYRAKKRLQVVLLKGHAGSGKTIILRRAAWTASHDYDCCCLYIKDDSPIETTAIQEIVEKCGERVYVFIDNAADRASEIRALIRDIGPHGELVTIVLAARYNEWNNAAKEIDGLVTDIFEVRALSEIEIGKLLSLLEKHGALGRLAEKSTTERFDAFVSLAGRQLLVALHEATLGKHFEEILVDEYHSLLPLEARHIYLTICILNRLDIPVRAGVVSRIHNIDIPYFAEHLFRPLEHVVYMSEDHRTRDMVYQARHPVIAEIVFERILTDTRERFEEYYRTLNALNIDYSTDRIAFHRLTKAKVLLKLFPNEDLCEEILELARVISKDAPRVLQQRAIFEMSRRKPDFQKSSSLLNEAIKREPHFKHYVHTKAELAMKRAESARGSLEREKYLNEASKLAKEANKDRAHDAHSHHTLAKVNMLRLEAELEGGQTDFKSPTIQEIVRLIESEISVGLQESPGNSFLLTERAKLFKLLKDSPRMIASLEEAFEKNPKLSYLAIQLADFHLGHGEPLKAKAVIEHALEVNRLDKTLNFKYATLLVDCDKNFTDASYYYKRSFSPDDSNYSAQLNYVKCLFLGGDYEGYRLEQPKLFNQRWLPHIENEEQFTTLTTFQGRVSAIKSSYAFVIEDRSRLSVMVPFSALKDTTRLTQTSRLEFRIAFGFKGLRAVDAWIL